MFLVTLFCNLLHFLQPVESDSTLVIRHISLQGNQRTKAYIIWRELDFHEGDTIHLNDLAKRVELNRRKIFNTSLFNFVEIKYKKDSLSQDLDMLIKVQEQWYILGYPNIQIADRNYNEWWSRGGRLDRLIFGANVTHANFRGRAEKLILNAEVGFTQKLDLFYRIPYIDRAQKTGLGLGISYSTNKNVAFGTLHDTLSYIKSDNSLRQRIYAFAQLKKRYHFYDNHTLELRYNQNWVADTIRKANPNYFLEGANTQRYLQLSYYFNYDFRDNVVFPLRGYRLELYLNKLGLLPSDNINQLDFTITANKYWALANNLFLNVGAEGKISFPNRQPFFNTRGLGYGTDLVRGYELYVIDGQKYAWARMNLRTKLLDKTLTIRWIKSSQFNRIPIQVYPNYFVDWGYVQNEYANKNLSSLANRPLYSTGLGVDAVTYYNLVVKLHWAINREGKSGIIFNITREF